MAAPYNPPVKNQDFVFAVALQDLATPGSFKANPTIASGDWKVDIDGAGFSNLGTLPAVEPASSRRVKVTLSSSEMNGDIITVQGVDQTATKEWADVMITILTTQ